MNSHRSAVTILMTPLSATRVRALTERGDLASTTAGGPEQAVAAEESP